VDGNEVGKKREDGRGKKGIGEEGEGREEKKGKGGKKERK
jgi:hypothetical protein